MKSRTIHQLRPGDYFRVLGVGMDGKLLKLSSGAAYVEFSKPIADPENADITGKLARTKAVISLNTEIEAES